MRNFNKTWPAVAVMACSIQHIACTDSPRQNQPPLVGSALNDAGADIGVFTREAAAEAPVWAPASLRDLTIRGALFVIGKAGAVPTKPAYRIRFRPTSGGLPWPDGDAAMAEFDHFEASLQTERIVGGFHTSCVERVQAGDVHTGSVSHYAERFPRYLDADGREMTPTRTPPEMERSYPSYWNRGPNRTLVEGERILAAILCWPKAACRELGGCSSPLFWKFPVSSDDRVDLSSLPDRWGRPGPSRLPLDAVYSFLADEHRPPPNDVSPLPPTPPSDGGSYPGRR